MKGKSNILIIIPTFNESENISIIMKQIIETISNVDILVVDDDSPDGTAKEVVSFSKVTIYLYNFPFIITYQNKN